MASAANVKLKIEDFNRLGKNSSHCGLKTQWAHMMAKFCEIDGLLCLKAL